MTDKPATSSETVYEAIERLRAQRRQRDRVTESKAELIIDQTLPTDEPSIDLSKRRASKKRKGVEVLNRKEAINEVIKSLLLEQITQGQALKKLRLEVLAIKQQDYADLVGVSRKTLSDIENDRGSYNTSLLNDVFKPFGLKVGLVPISTDIFNWFSR